MENQSGQASTDQTWRDNLPDEIKDAPGLKDVSDVSSLAKQFLDQQSYLGRTIRVPSGDALPEELKEFDDKIVDKSRGRLIKAPDLTKQEQSRDFLKSIGMPETPEDYGVPKMDFEANLPQEHITNIQTVAHDLGLTKEQYNKYITQTAKATSDMSTSDQKAYDDDVKGLRRDWGQDTDRRMKVGIQLANNLGLPQPFLDVANSNKLSGDWHKALYSLSEQLSGEKSELSSQAGGSGVETPIEMGARRDELQRRMGMLDKESTPDKRAQQKRLTDEIVDITSKMLDLEKATG